MGYIICANTLCRQRIKDTERFCPKHRGESDKQYNKDVRFNKDNIQYARFYASSAWREVRAIKLSIQPMCEVCLEAGRLTEAKLVHHIVEVRDDYSRRLDIDNLQSICQACHNAHHKKQ